MSRVQTVSTGYTPRIHQMYLHTNIKRFNVIICHRRFGKTHFAVAETLDQALRNEKKNPQYAYLAPTYGQAKRVVWNIMKGYFEQIPGFEANEADLRITIPRPAQKDKITIMLLGAENPGSLKGIYLDGVILDEFAEMNPTVWSEAIRPALSDRLGWAIFIGTPKGMNHLWEIYNFADGKDDWFRKIFKASETEIIPQSELDDAKAVMAESEYDQEYECSFSAALVGAYWGKEMEKAEEMGRITRVPHDPLLETRVYFDLGVNDMMTMWFVQNLGGREVRIIDYIEDAGQGLDYYARIMKEKGYNYAEVVLPHDGKVKELGTGKTRLEVMRNLMKGVRVRVGRKHNVADSINAARLLLAKCWFDKQNCTKGINALKNYQRVWDPKNKIFQDRPKHDWASHGADSFRLLAMELDENGPSAQDRANFPRESLRDFPVV